MNLTIKKPDDHLIVECASEDGDCMTILHYKDAEPFVFEWIGTGVIVTSDMAAELIGWMLEYIKPAIIDKWAPVANLDEAT